MIKTRITREQILNLLKTVDSGIEVIFTKADGSERTMKATLFPSLLPITESKEDKPTRKVSDETIVAYDLEKQAWRSFRVDSVIEINTF